MGSESAAFRDGPAIAAGELVARAALGMIRADARRDTALQDFLLDDSGRLDDRIRLALRDTLEGIVRAVESELIRHVPPLAAAPGRESGQSFTLLQRAGLLEDRALLAELLDRVRLDSLAQRLPARAATNRDRPSLLPRCAEHGDPAVASAAIAVMAADSARRMARPDSTPVDLPAEIYHRLAWRVAAALRDTLERRAGGDPDAMLAEAVRRTLSAYDEGKRLEATAMRLVLALDPDAAELRLLLPEALGDRQLALFVALLAHGTGVSYEDARAFLCDPDSAQLWVALRALDLPRRAIAEIGLALSEADPRRDLDVFADELDSIAAVDPLRAREAIGPLLLDPEYRAARITLGQPCRSR